MMYITSMLYCMYVLCMCVCIYTYIHTYKTHTHTQVNKFMADPARGMQDAIAKMRELANKGNRGVTAQALDVLQVCLCVCVCV